MSLLFDEICGCYWLHPSFFQGFQILLWHLQAKELHSSLYNGFSTYDNSYFGKPQTIPSYMIPISVK